MKGTSLNTERISGYVDNSAMLVTALSPVIGYQNAAHIAEAAVANNTTLREAAPASGKVTAEQFDSTVKLNSMIGDGVAGVTLDTIKETSDANRCATHDRGTGSQWGAPRARHTGRQPQRFHRRDPPSAEISWEHVRHEEAAAFAATADAASTGELAACAGSAGPAICI